MGRQQSRAEIVYWGSKKCVMLMLKAKSCVLIRKKLFTLTVTLTDVMTRWVHSRDQLFTSSPPKATRDWDSSVLPLLSRQDEHTTGCRCSTLRWESDSISQGKGFKMTWTSAVSMKELSRCGGHIREFAFKHPKCNTVSWIQVHCCVLSQALAVNEGAILGAVLQDQCLQTFKYHIS